MINKKNYYLIKKKDGSKLSFMHGNNSTILYSILKDNVPQIYKTFKQNAMQNFCVILTENDDIYIMYRDISGKILLSRYDNSTVNKYTDGYIIYENECKIPEVYMDALPCGSSIHICYAIKDENSGLFKIFHKTIDKNMNISSEVMVDNRIADSSTPFVMYMPRNGNVSIMYQKTNDNFILGRKVLKKEQKAWSSFYIIDTNSKPFIDYSLLEAHDNFYGLYIKNGNEKSSLICCFQKNQNLTRIILCASKDIKSCSICKINGFIWCTWINDNKIFSSFSPETELYLSYPYYEKKLSPLDIIKIKFLSNCTEKDDDTYYDSIYAYNNTFIEKLDFINVYIESNQHNKSITYYYIYYLEKIIKKLEQCQNDTYAICDAEKIYLKLLELKENLSKGMQVIEQNIERKNSCISELTASLKQKENEIEMLKKQIKNIAVTKTR